MTLKLERVSHHYRTTADAGFAGLADVSLSVAAGEIVALFGPSGCGKTTLLRLIAGHEILQSGTIHLDDQVIASADRSMPVQERPIGYVFQDYVLFPHLTVEGNIAFGLRGLPKSVIKAAVEYRVHQLRLAGLSKRYPHELSGGQQQRVALARALARKPKVLLLDEPFASLGMQLRQSLQEEFRQVLRDDQTAAIFVTHDPAEALTMGDRIALLRQGRLLSVASAQTHFENPASREAALLFSGHQMISGQFQGNAVHTVLGTFSRNEVPIGDAANGPLDVIISTNAIVATLAPAGAFVVEDCQFSGPGWTIFVRHSADDARLRFSSDDRLAVGDRLECSVRPTAIRYCEQSVGSTI